MAKGAKLPAKRGGMALCAASGRLWLIAGADRTGEVHSDGWEDVPAAAAVEMRGSRHAAAPAAAPAAAQRARRSWSPVGRRESEQPSFGDAPPL